MRTRVLIFCEANDKQSQSRTNSIIEWLSRHFEVHFATPDKRVVTGVTAHKISSETFFPVLDISRDLTKEGLISAIAEDVELISNVNPEIVIGNRRLSLYFSTNNRCKIYLNISVLNENIISLDTKSVVNILPRFVDTLLSGTLILEPVWHRMNELFRPYFEVSNLMPEIESPNSFLQILSSGDIKLPEETKVAEVIQLIESILFNHDQIEQNSQSIVDDSFGGRKT